jgi:hypothetical protein
MCKPKNLGLLALIKRSGRLSLKACDAQNLGHNRPPVVGFPIRITTDAGKVLRVAEYDGAEYVKPWGSYSMAPIVRAS